MRGIESTFSFSIFYMSNLQANLLAIKENTLKLCLYEGFLEGIIFRENFVPIYIYIQTRKMHIQTAMGEEHMRVTGTERDCLHCNTL